MYNENSALFFILILRETYFIWQDYCAKDLLELCESRGQQLYLNETIQMR